jgi:hypothetical protein
MTPRCKVGDIVEIHQVILPVGERAAGVPDDTSKVPLEAWIKGRARSEAAVGEEVEIETQAGRIISGTLTGFTQAMNIHTGPRCPSLPRSPASSGDAEGGRRS